VLSSEYWDDALPLGLSDALNANSYQYSWVGIDLYSSTAGEQAADTIYSMMSNVDYIIISSNRVMSALPHSPWRYPVQIEYYDLLTSGQLGFEQVAEFQTKPGIGPFQIDDRNADESFINYDHPRVLIFQKTSMIPRETYDALMAEAVAQPVISQRHANTDTIMLDEPVGNLPVVNDARWSSSLTDNSLIAAIWWIVFLFILQAAGLPIAMAAFRRFGDRGWSFARLLSLLVAGWLVWILASIEVISFRAYWCWIALALLAIPWLIRRSSTFRRFKWAMSDRQTRRAIIVGEIVFWGTFGVFLLFRYLNPDSWHPSWGGEKPMEFAHINAILRSAHFPPYDPWYSGGYINYYYYGSYLVAFCMKATGIPSEIAFNLAQPTFVAFLALAAYGLAATLGRMLTRTKASAPVIGVFGAVMLTFIGNLFAARKLIEAFPDIPAFNFGDWTWGATRLITNNGAAQIAEFPYFTGLYADLHAHMIAESITVLCLAVGLAIALEARTIVIALANRSVRQAATPLGLTLLAALVIGTLYPTNTWDFFTYAAFIIASLFVGFRFLDLTPRLIFSGMAGAVTVALGYVLFLPFHTHFVTLFSSVEQTGNQTNIWQFNEHFGGLLIVALLGMIALTWTRMPPSDFALTPSMAVRVALLLLGLILVLHLGDESDDQLLAVILVIGFSWLALVNAGWWSTDGPRFLGQPWNRHVALIGGIISFGLVLDERLVLGLCLALAVMAATLWFGFNGTAEKHLALMLAAGTAVAGVIEIVYVADNLNGGDWERMNTMFKFYNQAWILIALCGGTLLGWATWNAFTHGKLANLRKPEITSSALGVVVIGMLVIAAGFMYPLTSTKPRLEERFTTSLGSGTLNALDWMNYGTLHSPTGKVISFKDDLAAIDWFNAHVSGSPVIAEASIGPYRGNGSRFAIATGLPTVLGWDNHETQQRYLEGITTRYQDVRRLYQSADPAEKMAILNQYGVEYVIVGDVERYSTVGNQLYATPEGIAAFDQMVGNGLEIAFQSGNTTVYRVVPSEATTVGQAQ
jgi:YYY domain-containing protein